MNIPDILKSRQFLAALVALIVVFFGQRAGLTAEQVTDALYLLMSYIIGRGIQQSRLSSR